MDDRETEELGAGDSVDARSLDLGNFYQEIVAHTPIAILATTLNGSILFVNPEACSLFGYEAAELIGQDVSMLVPDTYRNEYRAALDGFDLSRQSGAVGRSRELEATCRDGSLVPVEIDLHTVEFGDQVAFAAMIRDVSARRVQMDVLSALVGDRTHELETKNRELDAARREAIAASRAKSSFLANMSHELRTPMTAILGYAELLSDENELELTQSERVHALDTIQRNGSNLLQLINDILDLSKVEAGHLELECIGVSPAEIAREIECLLRIQADEKGIGFELRVDDDLPNLITTDPTRVRQVLINLVGNAIKFTESGSVTLRVGLGYTEAGQRTVEHRVIDTGIGLTEDQISKLFQPFTQADNSMTRKFGGTGLGLSLCRTLAHALGGEISVSSTYGKGSEFVFFVPATGPKLGTAASQGIDAPKGKAKRQRADGRTPEIRLAGRILVVDDVKTNRMLASLILSKAGADVTVAENGQLALDAVESARQAGEEFDVILMDMQMPVMDGSTATRILRSNGHTRAIIAFTAHAMAGDEEACLKAGCDAYLTKPIDRRAMLVTIDGFLKKPS